MASTNGNAVKTWAAVVKTIGDILQVSVPTETRGNRVLYINLSKADALPMTDPEQTLVCGLQTESATGQPSALTLEDMMVLAALTDRIAGKGDFTIKSLSPAPVAPVSPPSAPVRPVGCSSPVTNGTTKASDPTSSSNTRIAATVASTVSGKGIDAAEQRVSALRAVVDRINQDTYYQLEYDIPTRLNDVCPNPSGKLWRVGFRMTKSCWVITDRSLDTRLMQDLFALWAQHGVRTHVIEYADSQKSKIKAIAEERLSEELVRLHTSLINNIDAANVRLQEALAQTDGPKTVDRLQAERNNRVRSIIAAAGVDLDNAIACAEMFDTSDSVTDLLNGLRAAIRSQAQTFNAMAEQAAIKPAPVPE